MLARVEDAGRGGELDAVRGAEVQPGEKVLEGFVPGEAGEFDREDNVDLAGADVGLEARAFLEILGLPPGGRGMAVVVDLDAPALRAGMGGELFALDGEAVGGLIAVLAGFADVNSRFSQQQNLYAINRFFKK